MSERDVILLSEHLADAAARWLDERHDLRRCRFDAPDFREHLHEAAGLLVRTYTIVDESLLDSAPRLRVVGRAGAGLDNIDVPACRSRGVEVVYAPDANTQAVVEYVLRLLLGRLRPLHRLDGVLDAERWRETRARTTAPRELADLTLGILGLGRIGRRLAAATTALGMRVLFNDLLEIAPKDRHGAEPVGVEALFERSDVISLHIDGRPANRHFVTADLLGRLRPDVLLINTSRGFVVDSPALARFLQEHPGATALLDVHEPEPFDESYPLIALPNAQLYPHLASRTGTAMERMSWVVRDVAAVLEGRPPRHPAPPMGATGEAR